MAHSDFPIARKELGFSEVSQKGVTSRMGTDFHLVQVCLRYLLKRFPKFCHITVMYEPINLSNCPAMRRSEIGCIRTSFLVVRNDCQSPRSARLLH